MPVWRVEIKEKSGAFDAIGAGIKKDIQDLGILSVDEVYFVQVYYLEGEIKEGELGKICSQLLVDNITQTFSWDGQAKVPAGFKGIEVAYNPGVMDPVEESVLKGVKDLGINGIRSVRTAKLYLLKGDISQEQLNKITEKLLYNRLIQHIVLPKKSLPHYREDNSSFRLVTLDILGAGEKKLLQISSQGQLFLSLDEMLRIKSYFRKLGRNPTDCELETIAQTWSEHCMHKTFRGRIDYTEILGPQRKRQLKINNLLKSTIMKVTTQLNKPWCVSVFHDNSGIIRFDQRYNVCFKVETHNHPSALEPFGGANTGVGGVIRDILGTGMAAKPIFNTDIFCFAPLDYPFSRLPKGALHPKRIMKGVVSGVRDYGNKVGIPTVNGAVLFHPGFIGNPLVYCGTAGIIPRNRCFKKVRHRDLIVLVGGRTGRDGIHGATFSSGELTHQSEQVSSGAVQIGNPIQEKKVIDTVLAARDKGLFDAITDCGAGGLSSAVGEMGKELGARVDLEKVPLKYAGLTYTEIWISESQERMVLAVPPEKINNLLELFSAENVEATVIGEFVKTGKLELFYEGVKVAELDMDFLHSAHQDTKKKAIFTLKRHPEPRFKCPQDLTPYLGKLLAHYDICSKEWIIRQYDHEVQGGSVVKPLAGINNDGPSDASVVRPVLDSYKGVACGCGINFRYGLIDPYWMAASCIDEALRQIIAVGGSLQRIALLDNFCWGNPDKPDRLGGLVRAALGCYDTARAMGVPFISGKDSLNNEYKIGKKTYAIPGTLLISSLGVIQDVRKCVSMYAKNKGNLIYLIGPTYLELGGSHYYDILGYIGNSVPRQRPKLAKAIFKALTKATSLGLVSSIHDCSEGGLAVALAEMAFAGGLGMELFLSEINCPEPNGRLRNDFLLFSESNSRFLVEVEPKKRKTFEKVMRGIPKGLIGCVSEKNILRVYGLDGKVCIESDISVLKEAWKRPLAW